MSENDEIVVGEVPSEEEMFYVAWGDDLIKDTINAINQSLRQLVTLSTALLAGVVAFFDKGAIPHGAMVAAMILLLASLTAGLIGSIPFSMEVGRRVPAEICQAIQEGLAWKNLCLRFSAWPMLLGIALLCLAILFK